MKKIKFNSNHVKAVADAFTTWLKEEGWMHFMEYLRNNYLSENKKRKKH